MNKPISSNEQHAEPRLIERAGRGDAAAFDELVVRHQDRVFNLAFRLLSSREDALDVAQEVFLTVYRQLANFEQRAQFSTWLHRVTVNRCRDELRRRATVKHTRPASLDAARADQASYDPVSPAASPTEQLVTAETRDLVLAAIDQLPDEAREILVLRDIQDLAYEEIADVLDVPVGTVRSRLSRARALLRDKIRPIVEGDGHGLA